MPEENFEQQVRRKTEAFGMEPNPDVWLHVNTAIAPAKRRRRVLLWWWMLPLCVAGIVALWTNQNRKPSSVERTSIENGGTNLSKTKEGLSLLQQEKNKSSDKKRLTDKKEKQVAENPAFQRWIDTTLGKQNKGTGNNRLNAVPFGETTDKEHEGGTVIVNTGRRNATGEQEETKTLTDSLLFAGSQSKANTLLTLISRDSIIIKYGITNSVSVTPNDSLFKKSILVTGNEKKERLSKKRSWQTGVTAEIGLTSWGKDLLYNEVGSSNAFTTTDGSMWSVTTRDSILNNTLALQQTKNGLTAAAGFVIRKEMPHHFYINGQVGYRYQQFKVYNLRLSSIPQPLGGGGFYFVNKDNYHTHFFNLTISAGKRLLSNKRNAISAEAGIDNSFLFMLNRQNAQQSPAFDRAKSLDAGSFNRWQPYFVASLPFDWHAAEKVRFVVSPFARFGLYTFQKNNNDYKNNHLISAGVQAVYFFK